MEPENIGGAPNIVARWHNLRALPLAPEPLCQECLKRGLSVAAIDVDMSGRERSVGLMTTQIRCGRGVTREKAIEDGFVRAVQGGGSNL